MRVLVAMSGGVDSSVAAARLLASGHQVVGATMKLWGGPSDSGCCSVADVDDARRVAQQLGIDHHVFNFTAEFDAQVVEPYVGAHAAGRTPNPCVECNRHLKFDRFLVRARQLGFDAIATGHHARVVLEGGVFHLRRGADRAKDQSYVLHMLGQRQLSRLLLPVGEVTKAEVRAEAADLGLRTATKPDSQDVCFIGRSGGRRAFLGDRIPLRPGRLVDADSGDEVGTVDAVELVTIGQRRGIGAGADGTRRYAVAVDAAERTVLVGPESSLRTERLHIAEVTWVHTPPSPGEQVAVQTSAHGEPFAATWLGDGVLQSVEPHRRVAPGQSVALYDAATAHDVLGGGLAT